MSIMEVSHRPQFDKFIFQPSTPFHHLWKMNTSYFRSSSFEPRFHAHKGLYGRRCSVKLSACGDSSIDAPLYHRRKYAYASRKSFNPQEKFTGLSYGYHLRYHLRRHMMSRYIMVRSELAGNGSPDAAYSLSDLEFSSKFRGVCFYAVTAIAAIFLFVLMLLAHPFVLLLDRYRRKAHHYIAKIWALLTVTPFFKIEFEGLENLPKPDTPAVYVSNHQSFLDIYTLLTLGRSFKFISKTAIFLFPVIGWAMFLLGTIPLKRMDNISQLECVKRCMDLVKKGASLFFFPEGTRSKDGKLGAFKKGAFRIAAKAGVPVVPISLIGTGIIMPAGKEGSLYPGSVKVVIHPPIKGNDTDILCNESQKVIEDVLRHQA